MPESQPVSDTAHVIDRSWYVSNDDEYIATCHTCSARMIAPTRPIMDAMSQSHADLEHVQSVDGGA